MAKIAIGGWQHETNTFATIRAHHDAFLSAGEWPAMQRGGELVNGVRDVHLPITGAIAAIEQVGHEIAPLLWCSATPSSYVTERAFETISDDLLALLEQALPVDGIYLDLHGAMVVEHFDDGEGEILARVRNLVGREMAIFVSLDLHANVTPRMVEHADVLDIFRTYPHIDMAQTGFRTAQYLCHYLSNPKPIAKAYAQIDFVIPLNTGCTLIEPCQSIYASVPERIDGGVKSLSFACGFHLSDIYHVGPSVVGYGDNAEQVKAAVNGLAEQIRQSEARFHEKIWTDSEGIAEAKRLYATVGKTIVMADTQDNPGGGGGGDTIGVLQAMIDQDLDNALMGVINDDVVADMAHSAGIGSWIEIELGGRAGVSGQDTVTCRAEVVNLSDGKFVATGAMYKGANMEIGKTAVLQIGGVQAVVCSKPVQTADQAHFKHLGIDPAEKAYVAVKSSVHFRNDYEEMASRILILSSPGEVYADPSSLKYQNARPNLTLTSMR